MLLVTSSTRPKLCIVYVKDIAMYFEEDNHSDKLRVYRDLKKSYNIKIDTYLEVQVSLLRGITIVTTSTTLAFGDVGGIMSAVTAAKARDVQ